MSPSAAFDCRFDGVGCFPIRQHHKAVTEILMSQVANHSQLTAYQGETPRCHQYAVAGTGFRLMLRAPNFQGSTKPSAKSLKMLPQYGEVVGEVVGPDGTLFVVVDRRGSVVKVPDSVRQWRDRCVGRLAPRIVVESDGRA
jgi:hypothetical protein